MSMAPSSYSISSTVISSNIFLSILRLRTGRSVGPPFRQPGLVHMTKPCFSTHLESGFRVLLDKASRQHAHPP